MKIKVSDKKKKTIKYQIGGLLGFNNMPKLDVPKYIPFYSTYDSKLDSNRSLMINEIYDKKQKELESEIDALAKLDLNKKYYGDYHTKLQTEYLNGIQDLQNKYQNDLLSSNFSDDFFNLNAKVMTDEKLQTALWNSKVIKDTEAFMNQERMAGNEIFDWNNPNKLRLQGMESGQGLYDPLDNVLPYKSVDWFSKLVDESNDFKDQTLKSVEGLSGDEFDVIISTLDGVNDPRIKAYYDSRRSSWFNTNEGAAFKREVTYEFNKNNVAKTGVTLDSFLNKRYDEAFRSAVAKNVKSSDKIEVKPLTGKVNMAKTILENQTKIAVAQIGAEAKQNVAETNQEGKQDLERLKKELGHKQYQESDFTRNSNGTYRHTKSGKSVSQGQRDALLSESTRDGSIISVPLNDITLIQKNPLYNSNQEVINYNTYQEYYKQSSNDVNTTLNSVINSINTKGLKVIKNDKVLDLNSDQDKKLFLEEYDRYNGFNINGVLLVDNNNQHIDDKDVDTELSANLQNMVQYNNKKQAVREVKFELSKEVFNDLVSKHGYTLEREQVSQVGIKNGVLYATKSSDNISGGCDYICLTEDGDIISNNLNETTNIQAALNNKFTDQFDNPSYTVKETIVYQLPLPIKPEESADYLGNNPINIARQAVEKGTTEVYTFDKSANKSTLGQTNYQQLLKNYTVDKAVAIQRKDGDNTVYDESATPSLSMYEYTYLSNMGHAYVGKLYFPLDKSENTKLYNKNAIIDKFGDKVYQGTIYDVNTRKSIDALIVREPLIIPDRNLNYTKMSSAIQNGSDEVKNQVVNAEELIRTEFESGRRSFVVDVVGDEKIVTKIFKKDSNGNPIINYRISGTEGDFANVKDLAVGVTKLQLDNTMTIQSLESSNNYDVKGANLNINLVKGLNNTNIYFKQYDQYISEEQKNIPIKTTFINDKKIGLDVTSDKGKLLKNILDKIGKIKSYDGNSGEYSYGDNVDFDRPNVYRDMKLSELFNGNVKVTMPNKTNSQLIIEYIGK